jgi:capsid protein
MSLIERVFPRSFARGVESRANEMLAQVGGYSRSFFGAKWNGGLKSTDGTLLIDHARMRRNARNIEQTSQQAKALINRDVDTTIDSGLMLVPEPKYEILGISAEEAEKWATARAQEFDLWAQSQDACRSGRMNFYQAQRLMRRYRSRDNECFVRHYYSQDPSLVNPLQFEILDPDQIRGFGLTSTFYNSQNEDGITHDSAGRETYYKIWHHDPASQLQVPMDIPKYGPKSGRIFMTHGFDPEYAGQTRGFSALGISMQELNDLLDYTSATINKAKNQSNIFIIGESSSDKPVIDPLAGFSSGGIGSKAFGSNPTPPAGAQNVTTESTLPLCQLVPEAAIDKPGSVALFNMPGKQTAKPFQNTAPTDSFNTFVDGYFAYIAAVQGQSIETVLMRFSNNYSASRATLILVWRIAVQRRYQLACDHLDPIYESWLTEEIAAGRVIAQGWQDSRLRAAWLSHRWVGSSMPNIDPLQTVRATELAAKLGLATLDDAAQEYNGSSGKSNRAKLKREYEELPLYPYAPTSMGSSTPQNSADKNENGDAPEDDQGEEEGALNAWNV